MIAECGKPFALSVAKRSRRVLQVASSLPGPFDFALRATLRANGDGVAGTPPLPRQIAAASLKIGRYMPITMQPTMPPMKIMIIGSSRLDSASTALLTSSS